jgi:multidrug efflux pump subunit AcrA (membrane-fusion protein)
MRFPADRVIAVLGVLIAAALSLLVRTSIAADTPKEKDAAGQGAIVIVARATTACFSAEVRVNGILLARAPAMVSPEVEGFRITQINVKEGDRVTSGQQLARLSRPADNATALLRAPAAGIVVRSTAVLGALASARAEPVFTIAIDGDIEVLADVPSIYIPKIAAGQTARVELEDNRDLPGRVRTVPSEINPQTQLGQVRISIETDPSLHIGTFARATIDASRSCGVSVPRAAVLYRTEGTSVQVVRDRVVETRRVQVGLLSESGVEIRDGVAENEVVIANAGGSLRDGEKVRPMFRDDTTGQLEER